MLLGKVIAQSALREKKFVTWFPCYGAEVRGGAAYCMVVISAEEIGSPYIEQAGTLIALNGPALAKFKSRLRSGGTIILNSSLAGATRIKGARVIARPFTALAAQMGNIKVANMLALGSLLAATKTLRLESALAAINDIAPEDKKGLVAINQSALRKGMRL